jgi:hypothetical protein
MPTLRPGHRPIKAGFFSAFDETADDPSQFATVFATQILDGPWRG